MYVNYLYIIIVIILIWYLYSYDFIKPFTYNKPLIVEVHDKIIKAESDNVSKHLESLKGLLKSLNTHDISKIKDLHKKTLRDLANKCSKDLSKVISIDLDYSGLWFDEASMVSRMYRNDNTYRSDVSNNDETTNATISKLLIDIDAVIYLIEIDAIHDRIILTNVYNMIDFLPKALNMDKKYSSYYDIYKEEDNIYRSIPEKSTTEDNYYTNLFTNDFGRIGKMPTIPSIIKTNKSQDVDKGYDRHACGGEKFANDTYSILLTNLEPNRFTANDMRQNILNTQLFDVSEQMYVTNRNAIPNYIPFADLSKIKEEKDHVRSLLYDSDAKQYLRNDYGLN